MRSPTHSGTPPNTAVDRPGASGKPPARKKKMTDNATSLAAALTSTSEQRVRRYRNESNVKVELYQLIAYSGTDPSRPSTRSRAGPSTSTSRTTA